MRIVPFDVDVTRTARWRPTGPSTAGALTLMLRTAR